MFKGLLVVGVAVTALAVADAARGAVTVIGGGLAEACSQAAMAGEDDPRFQELCTLALDTELMNARDRAGTFVLVDHALSRAERGLAGYLVVEGPEEDEIMHHGPADEAPAK